MSRINLQKLTKVIGAVKTNMSVPDANVYPVATGLAKQTVDVRLPLFIIKSVPRSVLMTFVEPLRRTATEAVRRMVLPLCPAGLGHARGKGNTLPVYRR